MIDKILRKNQQVPYDADAPVVKELRRLGYIDLHTLADEFDGDVTRTSRARLRYLAALMPDLDRRRLAETLTAIINNPSLLERDVRAILDGRSLGDTSRLTREIPIEAVQTVGRMLTRGETHVETARAARVAVNTVEAIDSFLGLTQAYQDRLMDAAVLAVRDNWSVRQLGREVSISKSQAHRLMVQARQVLSEIGEVAQ
jgi:hypothetical protein